MTENLSETFVDAATGGDMVTTRSGVRLAVDIVGDGLPIVLTHGWVVGGEMWEYVATGLADAGFRAISVHRRGCGRSSRPSSGYDLDTLADDLVQVLEAMHLHDVTLVAHSVGGAEAVRALGRGASGRIARLVLVATTTPGYGGLLTHTQIAATSDGLRTDRPRYVRDGVPGFFGPDVPAAQADWAVGLTLRASMAASIGINAANLATDTTVDVAACSLPTLVVHGDADTSAPLGDTGVATASALAHAELVVYPGGPHGLPLTHADQLTRDILRFISSSQSATGDGSRPRPGSRRRTG